MCCLRPAGRQTPRITPCQYTDASLGHPDRPNLPWTAPGHAMFKSVYATFAGIYAHMSICSSPGKKLSIGLFGSITSFYYQMYHSRIPQSYPSGIAALATLLERLCGTVETLALIRPIVRHGTSPLVLHVQDGLLRITAGRAIHTCLLQDAISPPPLAQIQPAWDIMPQPIWPANYDDPFPWSQLERLTVSYCDPRDEIYDHLSWTVHSLSLCHWCHQHYQEYLATEFGMINHSASGTLPRTSVLLSILARRSMLVLNHIEIEYAANEQDHALLQYVVTIFPHREELTFHRCRSSGIRDRLDVPVPSHTAFQYPYFSAH